MSRLHPMVRLLSRGKLTVLVFHKVPSVPHAMLPNEVDLAGFERVLDAVCRWFRVLPLDEAVLGLRAGNLPDRAACITFDDGYPEWLAGVVPVLERRGLHATFFVTSGQFFGTPMWNERIAHALLHAPVEMRSVRLSAADSPEVSLQGLEQRQYAVARLDHWLKYQEPGAREVWLRELEQLTGADRHGVPCMSADDLRAIHSKGFGIGGHSVTHPILARCNKELAYAEIAEAREQLEGLIGGKVSSFAYPNGVPDKDFTADHAAMVRRAGYSSALTTQIGVANSSTSVFQIPRFTPWGPSALKMDAQFVRNFFHVPKSLPEPELSTKKILMVAFHFPPQAGSSGILRTLNFVKNLIPLGWSPLVLSADPKAYVEQRNDLVTQIPAQVPVTRAFALDAARHLSIAGKYPRGFALPDRWSSWWFAGALKGLGLIRRERPAVIWSTYPISTAHCIGWALARWSGLPWVADFRDPMVSPGYPSDRFQRWVWEAVEKRVLQRADACVFTTERAAAAYAERYPASAGKCMVIENGYDEEAFEDLPSGAPKAEAGTVLMLHSGLIYPHDRNPSTFFAAVGSLLESGALERTRLRIRFRAPHHGDEVLAFAERHGLQGVVEVAPPIPYREAIAEMLTADLLLVFQGSNFNAQIPAKIYEYLRAQRPMLAVLDPLGDTAAQLKRFSGVYLGNMADQGDIGLCLQTWLETRGSPGSQQALADNLEAVKVYSRKAHALRLATVLDRLRG